jgi:hypothetical protein
MEGWYDVPSFLSNADISEVFRRPPGYFQPLISPVRPHTGVYTVTRGQVTLRVTAKLNRCRVWVPVLVCQLHGAVLCNV